MYAFISQTSSDVYRVKSTWRWFPRPFDLFLSVPHSVIGYPVYLNTQMFSRCILDLDRFSVYTWFVVDFSITYFSWDRKVDFFISLKIQSKSLSWNTLHGMISRIVLYQSISLNRPSTVGSKCLHRENWNLVLCHNRKARRFWLMIMYNF